MTAGQVSSEQLVRMYTQRINAYDQVGPAAERRHLLNPNAAAAARALDAERKARGPRGPLHGIPVLLKDNFDTSDMPTTGGSLALRGVVPKQDAFQVAKLRRAGAVLLGKVNLHELALGLTTVSSFGGQTLNPYDVTRAPGGSSGGSGVAAAACFAAFTLGTDTSGSIRIPELAQLDRRSAADAGALEPRRHHSVRSHPGHRRPDGAHGRRHRAHPRRDSRLRRRRSKHGGGPRQDAAAPTHRR